MNTSLRDLKRHVDASAPPPLDVEDIVARGDARRRRRRAALAAGSASLVVLAIVTSVALTESIRRSNPPADNPTPSVADTATPSASRPLTYTDDYAGGAPDDWLMRTIQYGDRVLHLGLDVTAIDVTDDGLALVAADGGIYVTDESSTEKIGETTIQEGMSYANWGVKTSTSGSLVAWFTPSGPDRSLVVYDAHERRMLADVPRPECVPDGCHLATVVGDRVYYWSDARWRRLMVLDVPTETGSNTNARALAEDLRSHPRGFVKGDSYDTGEVVNQDINTEAVFFEPRGSSLELSRVVRDTGADIDGDGEGDGEVVFGYGGYDTTGRRLDLRLPTGYTPAENPYVLFQWLDDDRFAVMAGATNDFGLSGWSGYGDILVCDIARERCTLAAPGPVGDGFRLVPHLTLPN